jgi:hypothetical protein
MVRITPTQGRFDSSLDTMATKLRVPVFVDNALHYAKVESSSEGSKVTIENNNAENYDLATEKAYSLVESESTAYLTHRETDGHTLKNAIYGSKGKNASTPLLYGAVNNGKRLLGKTSASTDEGLRIELRNMKSKTLREIGFDEDAVRFGQTVDVGFRTTDLAMRLGDSITGSITSVSIGNPLNTVNSSQRRQHSNVFLAANFNGVNLITSLRYLSKHDNSIPVFNRFGSLLHVPMSYFSSLRVLDADMRLGNKDSIPVDDSQNRVSVRGRRIALNEELLVTMDDRSRQQGRFDNDVIENITPVFDASITSMQQARRVARKMLKANSAMQGRIETNGHPFAFDLRPGDVVMYDGQKHVIIEATHKMARSVSDFVFTSVKSGIDGVLQGIFETGITESAVRNPETTQQIKEENFSFFNTLDITIVPMITLTRVAKNGFLIGGNGNRGRIGGNYKVLGLNKGTSVTMRGDL